MNKEEILKFNRQASLVLAAISDALDKNPPNWETLQLPLDWPSARAAVRAFAEDLMFCPDVNEAINRLLQDQASARAAKYLISGLDVKNIRTAIQLATAKEIGDFSIYPCLPFAAMLIELCDGLEKPGLN